MSLTAVLLLTALSAKTAGAATLAAGDTCTASVPFKIFVKRKPVAIAKGAAVGVTSLKGTLVTVSVGAQSGTVALSELAKKCGKTTAFAKKGDVTLDLGAGPIVKTEKQAEVAVVQAASRPAATADAQVELSLPPGRAATLIYTPIMNGGGTGVDAVLPALDRRLPQVLASIQSFGTRAGPSVTHLLDLESPKCRTEDACLGRIGKKLKADAVLTGVLTLTGDTYHLEFRLIDTKTGKASDHYAQDFPNQGLQPLIDRSIDTVRVAVRDLIIEEYGRLAMKVSEPRTQVRIDGRLVGLTPLAPRPLPPGDHQLNLQLEDFRPFAQKVTIGSLEDVTLNIVLEHTPEFIAVYKNHALFVRKIAWSMLGVGLVSAGGVVGLQVGGAVINNNAYNKYEGPNKPPLTSAQLKAVQNVNHQDDIIDGVSVGVGILAAAALVTSAVLFLGGDDPYVYDRAPKPLAVHLSISPGGVAVNGNF